MSPLRLLTADGVRAADGLAVDEALMAGYHRDAPPQPDTLRLYTYRASAALVGRFQDLQAEVDTEACAREGAEVGRRLTGGGAIVMGPAQLGVALVRRAPVDVPARTVLASFAAALAAGLADLGIEAALGGKNDLIADGRKIAGLGLHVDDGGGLLLHASLLADLDIEHMLRLLRIPVAKLGGSGSAAVRQRVTTVSEQTGRVQDGAALRSAVAAGFARFLGEPIVPGTLADAELARAERCRARYLDPEWLFPAHLSRHRRGSALLRTPAGLVRCYAATQGTTISHLTFVGDVLTMPESLMELEARLRWSRAEASAVARAVAETGSAVDLGCPPEALAALVVEALGAAPGTEPAATSYPVRPSGSCYFPGAGTAAGQARPAHSGSAR